MAANGKTVLVLGAGLCAPPLIKYLDSKGYRVIVASRTLQRAAELCQSCAHAEPRQLDVENEADHGKLEAFVKESDAVVSMLPYLFHPVAAKYALAHSKHFLTTSYVSDAIRAFDEEAKQKNLVFINECGVDPGLDHMSAVKVFDDVRRLGGSIKSFKSYCGGLPAPESNDRPMGYKFSWAPRGVLLAARNAAVYLDQNKTVSVPAERLFHEVHTVEVDGVGPLEALFNRDSVKYKGIYSLDQAETVMRCTFRYPGWSATLRSLVELGLLCIESRPEAIQNKTYAQVVAEAAGVDAAGNVKHQVAAKLGLPEDSGPIRDLEWLGLFSTEPVPANTPTRLDAVAAAMLKRMQYAPGEQDMIVMQHEFVAELAGGRSKRITSTMVAKGRPNEDTAMSVTVSVPVAIACHLVLSGQYSVPGVQIPIVPELYIPILKEMEHFGATFVEKHEEVL